MEIPFQNKSRESRGLEDFKELKETRNTDKNAPEKRINWNRQVEFLLTMIGYNVGFGNLWRFPYLCMRNGGGAFLIPYFFFLIVCGIPLFYLEVAIGQFSSLSPICVWKVIPLFKGLGWGMVAISGLMTIYFNVILAWTLFYLGTSFTAVLPWSNCNNSWNTPGCTDLINDANDTSYDSNRTSIFMNDTSYNQDEMSSSSVLNTSTDTLITKVWKKLTPAEEFFQFEALQLSDGIDHPGVVRWQILLCLLAAWVIVFLCLCKGIKSSGKVIYFTATAPYLFLTILLVRGVFLPGSLDGIKFYIIPDLNKLADVKVWGEACLQIFYTLGPCWGGLMTMSSYNKFHHNCLRDVIVSAVTCCGTSFYVGFVIFSIVGFMAKEANMHVSEVLTSGPGLVFIAFPDGLTKLPIAPMWSVFFFFMLLLIGLDSQFTTVETVISGFVDRFPKYLRHRKMLFTAALCVVQFILGIPLITQGGMYLFQIIDWYSAAFSLIFIGFLECVGLSYIYGLSRLDHDITMMSGHRLHIFWKICWAVITPLCLFSIIIFTISLWQPPVYGDYHYPSWAITLGWLMAMYSVVPIPLVAVLEIIKEKGTLLQRIKKLLQPADDWGPALLENRKGSKYYSPGFQELDEPLQNM